MEVITLFITNLRLLNLDLLPDWPSITNTTTTATTTNTSSSTFFQQDARQRIRSTEGALFHLFRLFDPSLTAEKLQPFYPPLEPIQSLNLRAALFRCLNELKKRGVLGRDVVLRKTMLDECQGEKFWELCLAFSTIVLRKVRLERKKSYRERKDGPPIAERLSTSQVLPKSQRESLLPLAIAHKASLKRLLSQKERQRVSVGRLYHELCDKEVQLARRQGAVEAQARAKPGQAELKRLEAVEHNVRNSWVGSSELRNVLLSGECGGGDSILMRPLDRIAEHEEHAVEDTSLLETLERTARVQSQRLRRWQSVHEKLLASESAPTRTSTATEAAQLRFDKHRVLGLREASGLVQEQPNSPQRQPSDLRMAATAHKYDEILTAMREELRRNRRATAPLPPSPSAQPLKMASIQPLATRKPSVPLDTTAGAPQPMQISRERSPSETAVPMRRPALGRHVSSRSKSYQAPKVEGQRQPIPLKSEIFSPIKGMARKGSASPGSSSTPMEETMPDWTVNAARRQNDAEGTIASGIGLISHAVEPEAQAEQQSKPETADEDAATVAVPEREFRKPALPPSEPTLLTQELLPPSLAARTSASKAFRSPEDASSVLSPPPGATPDDISAAEGANGYPSNTEAAEKERAVSLVDRTRQCVSNFNFHQPAASTAPTSKKKGHFRTYPINQFHTPRESSHRSSIALDGPTEVGSEDVGRLGRRRDITPREQLFSPDAGYDSVFKPRPKVKMSPLLSPQHKDVFELAEEGEEEVSGLDGLKGLRGSPLVVGAVAEQ